jgi:ATP-dependent DNA helicase RecQ
VVPTASKVDEMALERLRSLTGEEGSAFRAGQLEAIRDVVVDRARVLCVQRTGWGKSAVYFIATALLREAGAGPTLIVSPLLALMRNQIAAPAPACCWTTVAARAGLSRWSAASFGVPAPSVSFRLRLRR